MSSHRILSFALVCAGLALVTPMAASAQRSPVMMEIEGDFALPVTAPAFDRFLPGGGLSIGAVFAPMRFVLPTIRLRAIMLGDGAPPADTRIVDPGVGALYSLTAGLRLRTDGINQLLAEPEATGFWMEIDIGAALTGALARPTFEVALGFLWNAGPTDAGQLDVGPALRFVDVLQTDERGIDANSTYMVTLGLQFVLFDAAPVVAASDARVIQTRVARSQHAIEGSDTDGDGIDDADDACRSEPEDMDGVRDLDGCPDPDDDGDGIADVNDECPRDAEDVDQFEDGDGCPDLDNDGDSYPDDYDACPNEPETENGIDDADGCPDGPPVVESAAALQAPVAPTEEGATP